MAENMPPVGKILAVWGQPIIRAKEWKNDQASVNGGVMAWVLYDAEDGSGPKTVEGWIPFQFKWELGDSVRDGVIQTQWLLRSIDARLTGAGKLLVRASVSAFGEALEGAEYDISVPGDLPEDVHVLTASRTLCVPMEAGEKSMMLDEEFVIPPGSGDVEQILAYMLRPAVTEKKLMTDKFVFRGVAKLQVIYLADDGRIHTYDTDIPISQYVQLEREYGSDARMWLTPEISELELEKLDQGRLRLKGAIIGQYFICDVQTVNVVEDAYSNRRNVALQREHVQVPNFSSDSVEDMRVTCRFQVKPEKLAVCSMLVGQPVVRSEDGAANVALEGTAQLLYVDEDGKLRGDGRSWENEVRYPADQNSRIMACVRPVGFPEITEGPEDITLDQPLVLALRGVNDGGTEMVTGLELGEMQEQEEDRPSLILRKVGDHTLWELAKMCSSTVQAIRSANGIEDEPDGETMLLIPVE